ncbi:TonB-dependent receptor plug domain-containing protein [Oceanicaulis alexandrii]|uniref:TonB-dependent receptor plug domain-containing protein n=1 Tax=Oceanicaulis alexandrii TaxID=153233 RepID=UPI0003B39BC0|nr:TonB-dependent receptor [Oceanicaulis alexandrii]
MSVILCAGASALALSAAASTSTAEAAPQSDNPRWVDVITVTGRSPLSPDTTAVSTELAPAVAPDAAGLAARLPGAALVDNGALSGQVQYRGLYGARVAVRLDGQAFHSGGPNLMDPPLHYAPAPLLERLEVTRGPAQVSQGPSLSAGVNAVFKHVDYAETASPVLSADITSIVRSVDESYAVGGVAGIATDRQRFEVIASTERGEDRDTPYGPLNGTGHARDVYGLGYGLRLTANTEVTADFRRQEGGETGNPPFPMDIRYMDTSTSRLGLNTQVEAWSLSVRAEHARVDHAMNNFDQRPAPAPMRWRETLASSETVTFGFDAERALRDGVLRLGLDRADIRHDTTITNPMNADFFVTPFPDVELARTGAYAEWEGPLSAYELYAGVRLDAHDADAGEPSLGAALPMGPRMLAAAFSSADRSWDDMTVDGLLRLARPVTETLTLRGALARKSRVAGQVERYGWLPITASGGLADGNTYVGTLDLNPEVATSLEAGFDYASDRAYLRPTVYVAWVEDYIQGVPADPNTPGVADTPLEMVSAMNGDPTPLRFSNVDARLYGIDADFGLVLTPSWRLDGVLTYVRGERDDVDDDLYRITPASLRLSATYEQAVWSATVETLMVAEQDKVSAENSELETPGHVVLNAYGRWAVNDQVSLSAGVENILDQPYRDHLAGYNRNSGLGVPVGERLPGAGAGVWLRLNTRF